MYQNINTNKDCPLVSVVVCTYNQQNYIRDALDSILAQETDFAFEIILSDDCSNDRTPQICQEYADKYPEIIRFYHNKTNKGLVLNYYDSIRLAKSKYIDTIDVITQMLDKTYKILTFNYGLHEGAFTYKAAPKAENEHNLEIIPHYTIDDSSRLYQIKDSETCPITVGE